MDKKFYVAPAMEIEDVELERCMLLDTSGGDPNINQNWGGGGDGPIEWPEDE